MSYFAANTWRLKNNGVEFKGGDNNVVPRSNYWSGALSPDQVLYNIGGGMIQLTSRTEKNIWLDRLVSEYDAKLERMVGLGAYECYGLLEPSDEYIVHIRESVINKDWQSDTSLKKTKILDSFDKTQLMLALFREFAQELTRGYKPGNKYILVLENTGRVITKTYAGNRYRAGSIRYGSREYSKPKVFGEYQAEEIIKRYNNYNITKERV